jgi:hypothetical protein
VISVHSVNFTVTADGPCVVSVGIVDFGVTGTSDVIGPKSGPFIVTAGSTRTLKFKNPNPRILWSVQEDGEVLVTIYSSNSATVTLSGEINVWQEGGAPHVIS